MNCILKRPYGYTLIFMLGCGFLLTSCGDSGNDNTPQGPVPVIESFSPKEGPVETEVTITGTNFSNITSENEVFFNEVQASVISVAETEIKVEVPEGATTGKITIKVNDATAASAEDFTVTVNPWVSKKSFPGGGRNSAVAFSIGGKGYIGLGESVSTFFKDFWEYDPSANTWTQQADFPGEGRMGAVAFSIGSKVYVGTGKGESGNLFKDFWEYDPATDTWTQKADFGGEARYAAVAFSIGDKGYVGCGDPSGSWGATDFWEYDPATDTWTQKADFGGSKRYGAVGFAVGGKGYIGTGGLGDLQKDFWEYDPAKDTWVQKADFGGGIRSGAVAFVIGDKAYVGTGHVDLNRNGAKDFWKFDPAANTWVQVTDFFGGEETWFGTEDGNRTGASAFVIGTKGYVGIGDGNMHSRSDLWEYNPE